MVNNQDVTDYPSKPQRDLVLSIAANVQIENDDRQKRRQGNDDHIQTEIRT